jgi:hypothetical protein
MNPMLGRRPKRCRVPSTATSREKLRKRNPYYGFIAIVPQSITSFTPSCKFAMMGGSVVITRAIDRIVKFCG